MNLHNSGFFSCEDNYLGCIDFITNSRRLERQKTFSGVGLAQPKISGPSVAYTDSFAVSTWCDGFGHTPALMFTHNPVFNPAGDRWSEVLKWCEEIGVASDRIFFEASDKKYCKEKNSQVSAWAYRYGEVLKDAHVIHDGGNSYKIDGEYILEDVVGRISVMPSDQHGELSTCDNWYNAIVKNKWKKNRTNTNESYDALVLLKACDDVNASAMEAMFHHNFMLDIEKPSREIMDARLTAKKKDSNEKLEKFAMYVASYDQYMEDNPQLDATEESSD